MTHPIAFQSGRKKTTPFVLNKKPWFFFYKPYYYANRAINNGENHGFE